MVFPDLGTEVDTVGLGVISLSKSSLFGLIPLIKSFISSPVKVSYSIYPLAIV